MADNQPGLKKNAWKLLSHPGFYFADDLDVFYFFLKANKEYIKELLLPLEVSEQNMFWRDKVNGTTSYNLLRKELSSWYSWNKEDRGFNFTFTLLSWILWQLGLKFSWGRILSESWNGLSNFAYNLQLWKPKLRKRSMSSVLFSPFFCSAFSFLPRCTCKTGDRESLSRLCVLWRLCLIRKAPPFWLFCTASTNINNFPSSSTVPFLICFYGTSFLQSSVPAVFTVLSTFPPMFPSPVFLHSSIHLPFIFSQYCTLMCLLLSLISIYFSPASSIEGRLYNRFARKYSYRKDH